MSDYRRIFAHSLGWKALVLALAASSMLGHAADPESPPSEAKAWLQEVAGPWRAAENWELRFSARVTSPHSRSPEHFQGDLWVGDSVRFRLEIPSGTYVSDGITFWEYHPSTKQVIIRSPQDLSGRALPGRLLFDLLAATPTRCDSLRVDGKPFIRLGLEPTAHTGQLDSITVWIDAEKRRLSEVATVDANGGQTRYAIQSLKLGISPPDARFRFEPPRKSEIVDMRP